MKEKDLIDLGFNRYDVSEEESGDEAYYYYAYNFGMISSTNDETVKGEWSVEIDFYTITITDINDLKLFIEILERNKNK